MEISPKVRKWSKVNVPLFPNIPQQFPCSLKVILKYPLFPKSKWGCSLACSLKPLGGPRYCLEVLLLHTILMDMIIEIFYYHVHSLQTQAGCSAWFIQSLGGGYNKSPWVPSLSSPSSYRDSTFLNIFAVPNNAVFWITSKLTFTPIRFMYSLKLTDMAPSDPITTGTTMTFACTRLLQFHYYYYCYYYYYYYKMQII